MLKKEFIYDKENGIIAKNSDEINKYITEKCNYFTRNGNFSNKSEIIKLYDEILEMIDDDIKTATFDFSSISVIGFDKEKEKKQIIYYFDIVNILGAIYYNTLFVPGNRIKEIIEGVNGPISTKDMYAKSYINLYKHFTCSVSTEDLQGSLYGDTLVFVTLVESEFKKKVKKLYVVDKVKEIENNISAASILSIDDKNLIEFLKNGNANCCPQYDILAAGTTMCYKLFKKVGVISNGDEEKHFIMNKLTLNSFCDSNIIKRYVNQTFLNIMETLFSNSKCNLRNDLAHCNLGNKNYYTHTATSLLLGLLMAIIDEFYLI